MKGWFLEIKALFGKFYQIRGSAINVEPRFYFMGFFELKQGFYQNCKFRFVNWFWAHPKNPVE
jgi:hypothetical protein